MHRPSRPGKPTPAPTTTIVADSLTTSHTIARVRAPSASRIPISLTRRETL